MIGGSKFPSDFRIVNWCNLNFTTSITTIVVLTLDEPNTPHVPTVSTDNETGSDTICYCTEKERTPEHVSGAEECI